MVYLIAQEIGGVNMLYKNAQIEKSLIEMGFVEFTEIQSKCMPLIEEGKDIIGHSQTGTGKTAAFTLPLLDKLDYSIDDIQAIILCPTRELVVQVKREIDTIGKYIPQLKTIAVYGGEPISKQIYALKRKPQIVVGTPGRTIDHINRKLIKLGNIKYLVLDEADEMLKMGFKEDIEIILESTNTDRQTVMFSATMPHQIVGITKKYMNSPELVSVVNGEEANADITQYYYSVKEKNKVEAVARLLHIYNPKLTLVFCNTKRKVDDVTRELTKKGYNVDKIHGDLQKTNRLHVLNKFHTGVLDMLVATDVAARGLDIKNVEVVINYDVPEKADYYVHRIGRTGRIGNKGYSFTLASKKEMGRIAQIERFTKTPIKKRNIPTPEKVLRVKQDKQMEEIIEVVTSENLSPYFDQAYRLLSQNEPTEIIAALLSKLEKNDTSEVILGDINEKDNGPKESNRSNKRDRNNRNDRNVRSDRSDRTNRKQDRKQDNQIRYHLNLGSKDGMDPKKFAEFVSKKVGMKDQHVKDITIRPSFSFFTASVKDDDKIQKALSNTTYDGKNLSIEIAKERKRNPRR
jgi:ATP-dependent RNA helicase DeaD